MVARLCWYLTRESTLPVVSNEPFEVKRTVWISVIRQGVVLPGNKSVAAMHAGEAVAMVELGVDSNYQLTGRNRVSTSRTFVRSKTTENI